MREETKLPGQSPRQTQISLTVLVVLGLAVLVYGWQKIGFTISSTFTKQASSLVSTQNTNAVWQDSDKDGLADYEEQYYGSNPYLPDTDGDATNDYDEIRAGSDPTCPKNTNCAAVSATNPNVNGATTNTANTNGATNGVATSTNSKNTTGVITTQGGSATTAIDGSTAAQVRSFLTQAGISESQLTGLSDADVIALYNNTIEQLDQQGVLGNVNSLNSNQPASKQQAVNENVIAAAGSSIATMSGTQLRELLVSAGFSAATLQGLSDTELRSIVQQALTNTSANTK